MQLIRVDRYLADMGIASRSELKELIRQGRVSVDGRAVTRPETKIDPDASTLELDGKTVSWVRHHYYMMDKPAGVLTATEDGRQKTVLDLVTPELRRMGLFPVGRLDRDTSGLLLLTDDGDFSHSVISPKSGVEKLYYAKVEGKADENDVKAFAEGLILGDGTHCLPAKLQWIGDGECFVTVTEGKYHQVKRMLASVGKPVCSLRRLSIGGLKLDESLGPGGFRVLLPKEKEAVFMAT